MCIASESHRNSEKCISANLTTSDCRHTGFNAEDYSRKKIKENAYNLNEGRNYVSG